MEDMAATEAAEKKGRQGRNVMLSRIHIIAKRELAMSDEDYRYVLGSLVGKSSCLDMDETELRVVLAHMIELKRRCAIDETPEPAGRARDSGKRSQADEYPPGCSRPQWRKVCWLQRQLHWNDKNLRGYIKHVTGLEHERFLDVPRARAVISGLVKVLEHEKKKGRQCGGKKRGRLDTTGERAGV
jgi:hypothetical protein